MNKWFLINPIILCFAWIKIIVNDHGIHTMIGGIALTFILYNWTRHAVFSTIRSPKVPRKRKINFAKLSKRALPIHKWTGSIALIFAVFHMILIFRIYGIQLDQFKLLSGFLSIVILILLVLFGWLRWYKTTVRRRYTHWVLAFLIIFAAIIHILIQ